MTPIDMVYRAARTYASSVAVEADGVKLTYAQLLERVLPLAAALQQRDPSPGSRVGLCAYNTLDNLISFLAIFAAGKTWVPLYPRLGAAELPKMAEFSEAGIVIVESNSLDHFAGLNAEIIVIGDTGPGTLAALEAAAAGRRPEHHARPLDATQALKFTGGTTGRPKGVMQPYRAWNTNIVTQIGAWDMKPGDRTLLATPMTHGSGTYIMPTLATGGTLVIVDRLRPPELLATLHDGSIATVFLPPTAIQTMADLPEAAQKSFPALRSLIYGAGPMRTEAVAKAQSVFGPCIATTYGQTEAPQIATCLSAAELSQPDVQASVGRETLLTRVGIMDSSGELLPTGEIGEVVLRGDLIMTGYWNQPDKTAETIIDGWLHTGDLGLLQEDGLLFLKGRDREVIITGGFNVYPSDVEHILGSHPGVKDCAVFGVPDDKWGEAIHAAVELSAPTDATTLVDHVKTALGSIKTPKAIQFVEALPRNAYGKLQRQELIDATLQARDGKGSN